MVGVRSTVTVKLVALVAVPPGAVTTIAPVVAPIGTVNMAEVALITIKLVTATPLRVAPIAPVKFVPIMVTVVPTGPLAGAKLVMVGVGLVTEFTVPVTTTLAAVAPVLATVTLPA